MPADNTQPRPHTHLTIREIAVELHRRLESGADIAPFLDSLWECPTCRHNGVCLEAILATLQLNEPLCFDELENGRAQFDQLMAIDPGKRLAALDDEDDDGALFVTWGLALVLVAQIRVTRDLEHAREMAELVLVLSTKLDPAAYGSARVADMIARGQAAAADVERRRGRLSRAEEWMVQARLAARQGTGRVNAFLDAIDADLLEALGQPLQAMALRRPANDAWAGLREIRNRLEARLEAARTEGLVETAAPLPALRDNLLARLEGLGLRLSHGT